MKARIVAIGNSRGVRIPKPLLEQAGLAGEVELHVENGRVVIAPVRRPRAGWAAAAALRARGEDGVLDDAALGAVFAILAEMFAAGRSRPP